jgi:hypothetical protein
MAYEPTDVANQSLDAAGVDYTLGNLEDGSRPAQVTLRAYRTCLRQLLRACHWDFARKTSPLVLLADATTNTPNVGTLVPVPWIYSYAYPIDCVKARYIPWNQASQNPGFPAGNITPSSPTAPLMTGIGQPAMTGQRIIPARFLITTDANNMPPTPGYDTPGISPATRTVVLTNVQNAQLVYTCEQVYPSIWDELFRAAFVAYLASEIAFPLAKDKKMGLSIRNEQIKIAKDKITQARIADGNEGWFSSDIKVDWMQTRRVGGGNYWNNGSGGGGSPGISWGGYDSASFADGSAF